MCTCCDVLSSVKHLKLETSPSLVNVHHTRHVQHAHMQVEDRRVDAERKLISLQVKYNTLEKTHSTVKQQMKKMKVGHFQCLCVWGHYQYFLTPLWPLPTHPLFDVHQMEVFPAPPLHASRLRCLHCCASIAPPQQMRLMLRDCSRHWNRAGMRHRP